MRNRALTPHPSAHVTLHLMLQQASLIAKRGHAWPLALLCLALSCDSQHEHEATPGNPPVPEPVCFDTDQDNHPDIRCGGDDCDDALPYVNPEAIDGPWSLEAAYLTQRSLVKWFSIEGSSTHWLTQTIDDSTIKPSGLWYRQDAEMGFGQAVLVDETAQSGHNATLLLDGEQAHVAHSIGIDSDLRYAAQAQDWQPELIATDVRHNARLLKLGDELHLLYQSTEYPINELHHAVRRNGQWEVTPHGTGRAEQLLLTSAGQLHILASTAYQCFRHGQSADGMSWSFSDYEHGEGCYILDARVGPDDSLYVLYRPEDEDAFYLAEYSDGQWSRQQLAPEWTASLAKVSLVLSATVKISNAGVVHITLSFHSNQLEPLHYFENSTGEWTHETVALQLSHRMDLSPEGEPIIGMSRATNLRALPQLAIARRTGNDGIDQNCNGIDGE